MLERIRQESTTVDPPTTESENPKPSPTLIVDDSLDPRQDGTLGVTTDEKSVRVPGAWKSLLARHGVHTVRQFLSAMEFVAVDFAGVVGVSVEAIRKAREQIRGQLASVTRDSSWTAPAVRRKFSFGARPPKRSRH